MKKILMIMNILLMNVYKVNINFAFGYNII